jgi:transcriptional regulator with XRE-family HTH domain
MTTIKYLRKKHKYTLQKLEEMTGIDHSYLSKMELGKAKQSPKHIKKMSQKLNENPDILLIAQGYLPDYTKIARVEDPNKIDKALKNICNKIENNTTKKN